MLLRAFETADEATTWVACSVQSAIQEFSPSRQNPYFVLGLPTGETPLPIYRFLAQQCQKGALSFKQVVTFNMDEYVGLEPTNDRSYHAYMEKALFQHIDLPLQQRNLLDGMSKNWKQTCQAYEAAIDQLGGVDLFLGGVGEDGHVAFNEPGSGFQSLSRRVRLTESTKQANARFFNNDVSAVPSHALTVGLGTLLKAKRLILVAFGSRKAAAVKQALQGPMHHLCPLSCIQWHPNAELICDHLAISALDPSVIEALS